MSGIFNNLYISSNVLSYCLITRMFVQKKKKPNKNVYLLKLNV